MITPAYSPTATERVLPRMALDFTTGTLDPRVTVTRALNTATRVNASGLIEIVNANLPRFDYTPVTLVSRGLLIEESRSNLLTYSEQINNVIWQKSDITISSDALVSPDGTTDADTVVEGSSGSAFLSNAVITTAAATYTYSIFVKRGNTDWLRIWASDATNGYFIWVNVATGVIGNNSTSGTGVYTGSSITSFENGWYRVTLTGSVPLTTTACRVNSAASNGSSTRVANATYGAWGAQLEAGAFATSYIPTTTTSLTRNADAVSMTGTNFSSWYNASEGAFVARFSSENTQGNGIEVRAAAGNTDFIRLARSNATAYVRIFSGGAEQVSIFPAITGSSWSTGVSVAAAYKVNSFATSASGTATGTDNSGAVPVSPTNMLIGTSNAGGYINAHMQRISYWPQRVINAEVQAFSK